MLGRSKITSDLGEHAIFGDEEAARLRAELDEVQAAIADLNARVHSQFTTIAAHAEIARQQADFVRDEARADLDRTRDTVIGLIDQVRADVVSVGGAPTARPGAADGDRLDAIEQRLDQVAEIVETCFSRQRELADTMAALIDTIFAHQDSDPVASLSLV